jgi:hypothetical protein
MWMHAVHDHGKNPFYRQPPPHLSLPFAMEVDQRRGPRAPLALAAHDPRFEIPGPDYVGMGRLDAMRALVLHRTTRSLRPTALAPASMLSISICCQFVRATLAQHG